MSDTTTVLVLTAVEDDTADAVIAELEKLPTTVVRIDVGDFPIRLRLAARHDGDRWRGRLWTDDVEVDLDRVGAVYYRRPTRFVMPSELSDGDTVFAAAEARLGFGGVLASLDAMWVNNPARVAIAEYKPVQLKIAAEAGLEVPRTLVTNDYEELADFAAGIDGPVVCKTFSSLVLSEGTVAQSIYTTAVEAAQIDPQQLATTAHLVQQWVPKLYDVRVTMVGRIPYAAAIYAGSDAAHLDWRADYPSLSYERIEPPAHVTAAMIRYLQAFGQLRGVRLRGSTGRNVAGTGVQPGRAMAVAGISGRSADRRRLGRPTRERNRNMTDWQDKAHQLAAELTALGVLEPGWRAAFTSVPRHLFVPAFFRDDNTIHDGTSPELRAEWLAAVYRDKSLITQRIEVPGTDVLWPTSSSTQPSLMARMLGLLDVADDHSVMEIGTGTGYNAALLSHRLGDANVASIDIDPALVEQARARLGQAGYRPFLTAGDGADGISARAPYDRIIATCAVPAIPPSWVAQLRDGGVIVADVRGEMSSALVTATKTGPDTVRGRFLAQPGHFMWLRADPGNPLRDGGRLDTVIDLDGARRSTTTLAPSVLSNHELRFMLTLSVPGISFNGYIDREHSRVHLLRTSDGSWAEIDATSQDGRHPTTQGGSRAVWDEVEAAAKRWADLGSPDRSRFGLTATSTGEHHVWLDNPDNVLDQRPRALCTDE